ncbi:Sperm-associated antigen 6 [Perkinsus olseni]|uniref:Sperm-associated antigen 6 n=1 Tax=Perkinsus olseni TaxID=32597 RepID=A0A7J6L3S9_PEROL|nr:Sperm-associated antigen 6 [Perkinsus olseni]KAF4654128.1 Sperm-associated antigen 6 [Perkinsus olseni]
MSRAILQVFEEYQQSRVTFVQTVAELANRPQNIDTLQNAGVMALLRPLLLDNVASIQQSAALALGRLANHSDELAESVVTHEILPQLVHGLGQQNRFFKKAAAFVLRAVAKHSPQLAQAVVDSGALESLVECLEDFDPSVKEASAWALGYIARHTKELALAVVDAGAVPLLVLCFQEPELTLKRMSASALADIAKHTPELAQTVVDAGGVSLIARELGHADSGLKRQVCSCLGQVAKHNVDLAEVVVEAEVFPRILHCLKDVNEHVRKNAATCIREIARHTPDLAKLIVNAGGVAAVVDYITEARGNNRLPGIMSLGFIAAFSETLALAVIVSKGIPPLKDALINEPEDHLKAASAWSLGQIGRHGPDHSRALAEADVLRRLLAVYLHQDSSEDLKTKAKRALKSVIQKCTHLPALEPLLQEAPPNIQKYVVHQFAKVLPNDQQARRSFVQSGGLQKVQEINAEVGSQLRDYIDQVNQMYPPEIVNYYSPSYPEQLLRKLEDYTPAAAS